MIKDSNGKEFKVDVSKLFDINGDIDTTNDSVNYAVYKTKSASIKPFNVEIVDSKDNKLSISNITDMATDRGKIVALDIYLEATHSGNNLNYATYYEDSMEKDCVTYISPYNKPMLKNHNSYSGEPLGRVIDSGCGPSIITDDRTAISLVVRVTDRESIPKFLDGRYKTLSMGASVGTAICSICGKTILKDGKFKFCGHWRGETYQDQLCYWGVRDLTYNEISTVNDPADVYAQITKIKVLTDKDISNGGNTNMAGTSIEQPKDETSTQNTSTIPVTTDSTNTVIGVQQDANKSLGQPKDVCSIIDNLLDTPKDNQQTQQQNTSTSMVSTIQTTQQDNTTTAGTAQSLKTEFTVTDKDNVIQSLKVQLKQANEQVVTLTNSLNTKTQECDSLKAELEQVKQSENSTRDMCIVLATSNKELMVDNIILKELSSGKTKQEDSVKRKETLLPMSMKDLKQLDKESLVVITQQARQQATVHNPTLANSTTQDSNTNNANVDKNKNNQTRPTVDDIANNIINKLLK